ncbi:MAG: hypothetical protein ACMG55_08775 [Microcoleus sp.]
MVLIRDLAQQALTAGYLTIEAENQLRRMLTTTKYDLEDLNAFMALQLAAMSGLVKQECKASARSWMPGDGTRRCCGDGSVGSSSR